VESDVDGLLGMIAAVELCVQTAKSSVLARIVKVAPGA
jgi:hypothetical protein